MNSANNNETAKIALPVTVMYYDSDAAGVMHNIAYLRHIETARTILAKNLGMSFQTITETGIHPVVLRTEIDYIAPALLGDDIVVHGRVAEVGRVRFCHVDKIALPPTVPSLRL